MLFKDRLRYLREEHGYSQKEVAEGSLLSPQCISQLESGTRNPTGTTLISLANFFVCSTDYLLGREDDFGVINIVKNGTQIPDDAQELVDIFLSLNSMTRFQVIEYARFFLERENKSKKQNF